MIPSLHKQDWLGSILSQYSWSYNGIITEKGTGKSISPVALRDRIVTLQASLSLKLEDRQIDAAMRAFAQEAKDVLLARLRGDLAHDPLATDEPLRQFLTATTGEVRELDLAALKQWTWLVKRKLFGLPVEHHLMIVLKGKQGGGKTRAIKTLAGPFVPFSNFSKDLDVMADQREHHLFTENFILSFEELAKADRLEVASLKRLITDDTISYRPLYSNSTYVAPNVSTLIGSSNYDLADLIVDMSGSRRFFQINCLEKMDWTLLNSIDSVALWKSVNEHQASAPIVPHLAEVRALQEKEFTWKHPVIEWAEQHLSVSNTATTAVSSLFEDFKQWQQTNNHFPVTNTKFSKILAEMPGVVKSHTRSGNRYNLVDQAKEAGLVALESKMWKGNK